MILVPNDHLYYEKGRTKKKIHATVWAYGPAWLTRGMPLWQNCLRKPHKSYLPSKKYTCTSFRYFGDHNT
jgi:hypothetical protein